MLGCQGNGLASPLGLLDALDSTPFTSLGSLSIVRQGLSEVFCRTSAILRCPTADQFGILKDRARGTYLGEEAASILSFGMTPLGSLLRPKKGFSVRLRKDTIGASEIPGSQCEA